MAKKLNKKQRRLKALEKLKSLPKFNTGLLAAADPESFCTLPDCDVPDCKNNKTKEPEPILDQKSFDDWCEKNLPKLESRQKTPCPRTGLESLDDVKDDYFITPKPVKTWDALELWREYWKLSVDHPAGPVDHEVWDGAIDTVCSYLRNQLCDGEENLERIDEAIRKTKEKFRCEP